MIITSEIKDLISEIYEASVIKDHMIRTLVYKLQESCLQTDNRKRYETYPYAKAFLEPYPIDSKKYAVAFDPINEEKDFFEIWSKYGVVVGKDIASPEQCAKTTQRLQNIFYDLSNGKGDIFNTETYHAMPVDINNTPLLSRGFFEIYHDDSLAQLRQNIRSYIHHTIIWGRADLWTTFDRFGVKPPHHEEAKGLPLHVDQNPNVHPGFKTLQGVLALSDCPEERGTFLTVPGSRDYFKAYSKMAKNNGEYVELDPSTKIGQELISFAQPIPLRAGSMVSWDSRTTHANTSNVSNDTRVVAYIAAGPSREDNPDLVQARMEGLKTGFGTNVREALMHASKKPRFNDNTAILKIRQQENLSLLGKLLYGMERYDTITTPHLT